MNVHNPGKNDRNQNNKERKLEVIQMIENICSHCVVNLVSDSFLCFPSLHNMYKAMMLPNKKKMQPLNHEENDKVEDAMLTQGDLF